MVRTHHPTDNVLRRVAVGFSIVLSLCWLFEILEVPHVFFHESAGFTWPRILFRTVVLLAVWAWMHKTIKRLLKRLHHLEGYLLMCGWCRKIGDQGRWLTTEEYFGSKFETETSHGICPDCARLQVIEFAATGKAAEEA